MGEFYVKLLLERARTYHILLSALSSIIAFTCVRPSFLVAYLSSVNLLDRILLPTPNEITNSQFAQFTQLTLYSVYNVPLRHRPTETLGLDDAVSLTTDEGDRDSVSIYIDDDENSPCGTDINELSDASMFCSTDDDLEVAVEAESRPAPLDSRFVFQIPAQDKGRLSVTDPNRGNRRTSTLGKSFKRAKRRMESFGNESPRVRLNSAGTKLKDRIHRRRRKFKKEKRGKGRGNEPRADDSMV